VAKEPDPNVTMDPKLMRELQGKHRQYHEGRERRRQVLAFVKEGKSIDEALSLVRHPLTGELEGIKYETYRKWRQRYPEFRHEVDSARLSEEDQPLTTRVWTGNGFAPFRKQFFGMDSPWFHLEVVDALENGEPGSITLILLPPEHGKTTLLEDFCNYKLAVDSTFRITYGSEGSDHAEKALGRIRNRMEPDGGARDYVREFGPFEPDKENRRRQKWTDKKFNVRKKGSHDERDYSMVALGITSRIAGSRTDLLVIDDVMSLRNLGQAEDVFETIRQDWISRPGVFGATVIIGTRVGEGDVYELMMDATRPDGSPWLTKVIKYAAVRSDGDGKKKYLWPERYTPADYEKMEGNVGEDAWLRNYQQRPRGKQQVAFTGAIIGRAQNTTLSWWDPPPQPDREETPEPLRLGFTEIWAGVDPALGGVHATGVAAIRHDRFRLLDLNGKEGLAKTSDMVGILDSMLATWADRGLPITKVVIEDKHQRNLMNDEEMIVLQARYGFDIIGHQTQGEKNDENIGVSAMAKSMNAGEFEIPWADNPETRERFQPLVAELLRWRPNKKATRLKQDRIMAVWFMWLWWRRLRRATLVKKDHVVQMTALPFTPTNLPMHTGGLWTPESSRPPRRRSA
jgi:hypothetical protein